MVVAPNDVGSFGTYFPYFFGKETTAITGRASSIGVQSSTVVDSGESTSADCGLIPAR